MSNVQSYNALIDRFKAFASGHFILKSFSHGQIDTADLEKFTEYPFMHVVPSNVTYAKGMKTFSFQIVLADLPRDKDDKVEFQREVLSDLQRIAEDLVAEITNHRVLFGDLITVQNVSLEPFLEEFHNTLTGWTVSLELLVPYYWDACSIPAEWNDMFESGSGGTGSILTFIDSITRDEYGNVSLVNDEATPAPNYYYGTNDEGVRGWYLLTDEVGLTCATIGTCQTIIDIEAEIDLLQQDVTDLQADVVAIEAELPNKVPYTGATGNVDLGEYELKAGQIEFDTTPTGTAGAAVMRWNDTDGTIDVGLKGGNVTLQVGQESVVRVVNKAGADLLEANYQAVRVRLVSEGGAQGQRLAVVLALADTDADSATTIGLVTETINNNQEGFITTSGEVRGINTTGSLQGETWVDGDILYLSGTTAGRITNIKPSAPTHTIIIGYVVYAHQNNGKIFVKVDNGYELDELHNVSITTPANNEGLFFESSTSLWKNKTIETALGYTPFNLPSLTSGSVLFSNGTTIAQDNANLFFDNTNKRLGIGTASPAYGLDVNGTARVQGTTTITPAALTGSAATSALDISQTWNTTGSPTAIKLNITNTASVNASRLIDLQVGGSSIFSVTRTGVLSSSSTITAGSSTITGTTIALIDNTPSADVYGLNNTRQITPTAGNVNFINYTGSFTPNTAVTSQFRGFNLAPTINQTGGANGITRGIYINPTLIAAADFRAIETTNGKVIFGGTGNVLIGTTTDAGFKLDVNGNARISGTGNTSSNSALVIQNSDAVAMFSVRNDGGVKLSQISTATVIFPYSSDENTINLASGRNIAFNSPITTQGSRGVIAISGVSFTGTGINTGLGIYKGFAPTGGAGVFEFLRMEGVINQTGGANGITRGLYINPTLTSAADFRAIETTAGNVMLNTTSGNTLIGTTTNAGYKLDVNGTARVVNTLIANAGVRVGGASGVGGVYVQAGSTLNQETIALRGSLLPTDIGNDIILSSGQGNATNTTSIKTLVRFAGGFVPTSGTGSYTIALINPTINQTGGANGITRGLYIDPTLTAAADFRAIETTRGRIVFGNLPTSSAGLPTGAIWNDGGTVKIV